MNFEIFTSKQKTFDFGKYFLNAAADAPEPDTSGPHAGQDHEADADHLHRVLPVVPGWSGSVLAGEQHSFDLPAVVHYPQDRSGNGRQEVLIQQCF